MTINRDSFMYEQCCTNATTNTYCESYVSESNGYGIHPAFKGRSAFEGGRQANSLCQRLEGVNKGQLGITDCPRFPDTLCRATHTGEEAKSAFLPLRAVSSDTRGSLLPSGEGGSDSSRQSPPSNRVLLCPLPGPQEEWANEASDQPQSPQSMGRDTPLQDGRSLLSPRPVETGRLVGKGGSKGCLPDGSNTSRPPTLPPLHGRGSELPVHLPSLRTGMCSVGLHQGNEGGGDPTQVMGSV